MRLNERQKCLRYVCFRVFVSTSDHRGDLVFCRHLIFHTAPFCFAWSSTKMHFFICVLWMFEALISSLHHKTKKHECVFITFLIIFNCPSHLPSNSFLLLTHTKINQLQKSRYRLNTTRGVNQLLLKEKKRTRKV